MTNENKAKELGTAIFEEWGDSALAVGVEKGAVLMAEWKDEQFKDYFHQVLSLKILYFLNEKEKRENTTIDKMDWHKTMDEFVHYLKQQEN